MTKAISFKNLVKEKFDLDADNHYFPDQTFINRLVSSLDKVEANNYNQSRSGFISEFNFLTGEGVVQSINEFVDGCLHQLLWIYSILQSGRFAENEEDLEAMFDYITPTLAGDSWTLYKLTKKGVFFRGAEPYQDSRVVINSINIIEISLVLSEILVDDDQPKAIKVNNIDKGAIVSSPKKMSDKDKLKNYCMDLLKKKLHAPNSL